MTGVLRELAANPRGFARDFALAKRVEGLSERGFELPMQAAADEAERSDVKVESEKAAPLEAPVARRSSSARRRPSRPTEGMTLRAAQNDAEQVPSYFRRRSEALPGTYNRSGAFSSLNADSDASRLGSPVSSIPYQARPEAAAPQEKVMSGGAPFAENQQSLGESPLMDQAAPASGASRALTPADEAVIRNLKKLERELMGRTMEQARAGAGTTPRGRQMVETGPDGERYVTEGAVSPTLIQGGTAEQELLRARAIRRATQALSNPSTKDLAVASEAARRERVAEKKIEQEVKERAQIEQSAEKEGVFSAQASLEREILASARRDELRAAEERSALQRKEARSGLKVPVIGDPNIPNAEVVSLQRAVAIDAYLTQL